MEDAEMAGENHSCHCSDDNVHGHDCHGHGKGNETARVYETVLALALFAVGMLVKLGVHLRLPF